MTFATVRDAAMEGLFFAIGGRVGSCEEVDKMRHNYITANDTWRSRHMFAVFVGVLLYIGGLIGLSMACANDSGYAFFFFIPGIFSGAPMFVWGLYSMAYMPLEKGKGEFDGE